MKLITSFQIKLTVLFTAILFSVTNIWAVTYYSQASGNPTVLTNWNSVRTGGGSTPANFTGEDVFVIQSGHNMTSSAGWTVGSGTVSSVAKLQIENGGILTANSTTATSSITMGTTATLQVDAGGKIVWITNAVNTNSMLGLWKGIEAFDAASDFEFQGNIPPYFNGAYPDVNGYGNVIFNCSGANVGFNANVGKIRGNLTVLNASGTTGYNFGNINKTIPIGGNLTIDGANLTFKILSTAGTCNVSVGGNIIVKNGAKFNLAVVSGGVANVTVGGDITIQASSILAGNVTDLATPCSLILTGNGKNITSNGTFNTGGLNVEVATGASIELASNLDVAVNRTLTVNGTLKCGNSVLSGAGNFTLNTGATLIHTNTGGINAVVAVTGTKTINGTVTANSALDLNKFSTVKISSVHDGISIHSLNIGDLVSVYSVEGKQLHKLTAFENQVLIPSNNGLYIVKVVTKAGILSKMVAVK
jgi:hypothetical protein